MVAVAGASLVGGAMSSHSAGKAADKAAKANDEAVAFERQRYADWQEVYGPMQDNLASYYENVSPDYYAAIGLETFEEQYQTGLQRMEETFAQRGIDTSSGIALSLASQGELNAAETRAQIRRDAPRQAIEDKTRFLQIGLGQNPASSLSNTLANQASNMQTTSNYAQQAAGEAVGSAISATGKAIDAYNTRDQ